MIPPWVMRSTCEVGSWGEAIFSASAQIDSGETWEEECWGEGEQGVVFWIFEVKSFKMHSRH